LTNQKKELSVAAMFVNRLGQMSNLYKRTFHRCFLPSFGSFGHAVSEEITLVSDGLILKILLFCNRLAK
jgi:hypothetical protein